MKKPTFNKDTFYQMLDSKLTGMKKPNPAQALVDFIKAKKG